MRVTDVALCSRHLAAALPSPRRRAPLHLAAFPSSQSSPPLAASLPSPAPRRAPIASPPSCKALFFGSPLSTKVRFLSKKATNRRFRHLRGRIRWLRGWSRKESSWHAKKSRQRARLPRRRPPPAAVQFAASDLHRACSATPSPSPSSDVVANSLIWQDLCALAT